MELLYPNTGHKRIQTEPSIVMGRGGLSPLKVSSCPPNQKLSKQPMEKTITENISAAFNFSLGGQPGPLWTVVEFQSTETLFTHPSNSKMCSHNPTLALCSLSVMLQLLALRLAFY